jgi:hypothetical protein
MRLLVITSNPGITPSHRQEILTRLRREGLMVRNARIVSDHIELDVVADDEREVRLVERLGLKLQEIRVIDMERTINYDVHDALFKYVELFNKERFCCPVPLIPAFLIILHLLSGLRPHPRGINIQCPRGWVLDHPLHRIPLRQAVSIKTNLGHLSF